MFLKILFFGIVTSIVAILLANHSHAFSLASEKRGRCCIVTSDTMPSHVGKAKELDEKQKKWVYMHIKYPKEALENNIQGNVTVQFVIETDGSISNVKVIRSAHPLLNEEAVRVIKNMPKFKPIIEDGKPVKAQFTMVVPFKLN